MYRVNFRSIAVAVAILFLSLPGCGTAGRTTLPIQTIPDSNRFTMEEFAGKPVAVRLTQGATVSGLMLPTGSIIRQTSETTCSLFPSETMVVGGVQIPAASEIELVLNGHAFVWNGIVKLGETTNMLGLDIAAGDGVFFTGDLLNSPVLTQIRLGNHREVAGNWYPAGSIIYVDPAGAILSVAASMNPEALAKQQALYRQQKAERISQCNQICAPHEKDPDAKASCMDYCLNQ